MSLVYCSPMSSITVHMVIRNEEQWVWYALKSVLPYVKQILIYDTGSSDDTLKIIKSFSDAKIHLEEKGIVNPKQLAKLRNEQIAQTTTDWFLVLDGDEVWPENTLRELDTVISNSGEKTYGVVVKARIPVGDLFHYQSEIAGKYELLGRVGHYNMRAYKKSPKYHWEAVYPYTAYVEKYVDKRGISVQERQEELLLLKHEYWHMTHLRRSRIDTHRKYKLEIGETKDYLLPQVFFQTRPNEAPSPWIHFTPCQRKLAEILTPLRMVKRKLT